MKKTFVDSRIMRRDTEEYTIITYCHIFEVIPEPGDQPKDECLCTLIVEKWKESYVKNKNFKNGCRF